MASLPYAALALQGSTRWLRASDTGSSRRLGVGGGVVRGWGYPHGRNHAADCRAALMPWCRPRGPLCHCPVLHRHVSPLHATYCRPVYILYTSAHYFIPVCPLYSFSPAPYPILTCPLFHSRLPFILIMSTCHVLMQTAVSGHTLDKTAQMC